MPLEKKFIRDGHNRLVGSVTRGTRTPRKLCEMPKASCLGKPIAGSRTRGTPTAD
jgi:hypothetical protein